MREFSLCLLIIFLAPAVCFGEDVEVRNDGWSSGIAAAFQAGFAPGEIAAVRLVPAGPLPCTVQRVRFLFGGASETRTLVVHIWDDVGGADTPGTELYAGSYQVTASDTVLQEVSLGVSGVSVSGPFRVGIELTHAGTPSVARDSDGLTASCNFVKAQEIGWVRAESMGVTGDWIIRAVVGEPGPTGPEVGNDGWTPGAIVGIQAGFLPGEIAAARLTPAGPLPCMVERVRFFFGGASGTRTVNVHIWEDDAEADSPGAELFDGSYEVTASNDTLQEITLGPSGVPVSGPFRVGIELTHAGAPSVARDSDGLTAGRNFVKVQGSGWLRAEALGVTGDWIIRAMAGCDDAVRFERGDANADGAIDISDAIAVLSFLFLGDHGVPCEQAGDANDDGALDISDAVFVLSFLFLGGTAPSEPQGSCGLDLTPDDLACDSFPACP